ncbi:hypothetical protein ADUPG1_000613, partial [Aduncisulcus paluster]
MDAWSAFYDTTFDFPDENNPNQAENTYKSSSPSHRSSKFRRSHVRKKRRAIIDRSLKSKKQIDQALKGKPLKKFPIDTPPSQKKIKPLDKIPATPSGFQQSGLPKYRLSSGENKKFPKSADSLVSPISSIFEITSLRREPPLLPSPKQKKPDDEHSIILNSYSEDSLSESASSKNSTEIEKSGEHSSLESLISSPQKSITSQNSGHELIRGGSSDFHTPMGAINVISSISHEPEHSLPSRIQMRFDEKNKDENEPHHHSLSVKQEVFPRISAASPFHDPHLTQIDFQSSYHRSHRSDRSLRQHLHSSSSSSSSSPSSSSVDVSASPCPVFNEVTIPFRSKREKRIVGHNPQTRSDESPFTSIDGILPKLPTSLRLRDFTSNPRQQSKYGQSTRIDSPLVIDIPPRTLDQRYSLSGWASRTPLRPKRYSTTTDKTISERISKDGHKDTIEMLDIDEYGHVSDAQSGPKHLLSGVMGEDSLLLSPDVDNDLDSLSMRSSHSQGKFTLLRAVSFPDKENIPPGSDLNKDQISDNAVQIKDKSIALGGIDVSKSSTKISATPIKLNTSAQTSDSLLLSSRHKKPSHSAYETRSKKEN